MGLHQTEKLLNSKRNNNQKFKKAIYRIGKKYFKPFIRKGVKIQNV